MKVSTAREFTLRLRVEDEDGNLTDADAAPTVELRDPDGDVVTSGTATSETTGVYSFTVAGQDEPDVLTATWEYAVSSNARVSKQTVRVTGGRLVPLWRYREETDLSGLTGTALRRLADAVEDWFARALEFPVTEEGVRITKDFAGGPRMAIRAVPYPKRVVAATVNDTPLTAQELADIEVVDDRFVIAAGSNKSFLTGRAPGLSAGRWKMHVVHGPKWDDTPADLTRAAVIFAGYIARANNYPERASQVATEGALITLAMPSHDAPTGLPEVDAVVTGYRDAVLL